VTSSRNNLVKRDVLNESQKFCLFDCGKEENVSKDEKNSRGLNLKGRKTQEGGLNCVFKLLFSLFKTQNMNDQKQIRQLLIILFRSVCSGMKNREKREEAEHKRFIQVPSTTRK